MMAVLCLLVYPVTLVGARSEVQARNSSVVFYVPFDNNTANAAIGSLPTATGHDGGPKFEAQGKRGGALYSGDSTGYVSYDAKAALPVEKGTLEFWIKPVDWEAIETMRFHVWVETESKPHWFLVYKYFWPPNIRFIRQGKSAHSADHITVLQKGKWHHIAVTWTTEETVLYIDGEPSHVMAAKDPPTEFGGRVMVGDRDWKDHMKVARNEHSLIDELYIYDRALEPAEIKWAIENTSSRQAGADIPAGIAPPRVYARVLPSRSEVHAEVRHRLSEITGTAELLGPTPVPSVPLTIEKTTANAILKFDDLAKGDYTLHVVLRDKAGNVVGIAEDSFYCPGKPVWLGNTIGISGTPPPPYTPIEATRESFSCWGREYKFDPSGLVHQVRSAGADLLASPMEFNAVSDGQKIKWRYKKGKLIKKSAVAAQYQGSWKSKLGEMQWDVLAEFDGMVKYTLTLSPVAGASVGSMELRFPMPEAQATLNNCDLSSGMSIGEIPKGSGAVVSAPGAIYWWLGNEDRGLAGYCDSDEAWDRTDRPDDFRVQRSDGTELTGYNDSDEVRDRINRPNGFRIERKDDTVEAVLSFIASTKKLDKPWTFTFAVHATPVKDTAGCRKWRVEHIPDEYNRAPEENVACIWTGNDIQFAGDPRPRPGREKAYAEKYAAYRERGLIAVQYTLLCQLVDTIPIWRYYGDEWWDGSVQGEPTAGQAWVGGTGKSQSYKDYVVWRTVEPFKRYGLGGIYTDNAWPRSSANAWGGTGYMRDGVRVPTQGLFDYREIFKRVYTAIKEHGQKENKPTYMISHGSGQMLISQLGFMDARWDGEHLRAQTLKNEDYHDLIPLDVWRAQYLTGNFGAQSVFLSEIHSKSDEPTRKLMGLQMLHDVSNWGSASKKAERDVYRVQEAFGIVDAELIGYWKNEQLIGGQSDDIKATIYRKKNGSSLIVVCNLTKQDKTATLAVDWSKLKPQGPLTVIDAESSAALDVTEGLTLQIPPRDYRVVWSK